MPDPNESCCRHCPGRPPRPDPDYQSPAETAAAYTLFGFLLGLIALLIAVLSVIAKFDGYTAPGDEPAQTIAAVAAGSIAALLLPGCAWAGWRQYQAARQRRRAKEQRRMARSGAL